MAVLAEAAEEEVVVAGDVDNTHRILYKDGYFM